MGTHEHMMGWKSRPPVEETDKPKGFDDFDLRLGDVMRGERATLGKSLLDVQRELKIKATYIAAIENADISAFETQGFVAGYVRSYARYLGMDPDEAFAKFCREANFQVAHGMSAAASSPAIAAVRTRAGGDMRDPFTDPNATFIPRGESFMARVEPGAIGSIAVLVALIAGLGYGGWSVLQEVQRVSAEAPTTGQPEDPVVTADAGTVGNAALERLYRPEALDVPVMEARDGPIAAIDPRITGLPSITEPSATVAEATPEVAEVQVVENNAPPVELLAVRPSWVRVSAADGSVLFEKILDAGERYVVPQFEEPATLRTGNSGSVYFAVNGQTFGPSGPGANVVKDIPLTPDALTTRYAAADPAGDADLAQFVAEVQPADLAPALPASE
jgi:hypothetical protein